MMPEDLLRRRLGEELSQRRQFQAEVPGDERLAGPLDVAAFRDWRRKLEGLLNAEFYMEWPAQEFRRLSFLPDVLPFEGLGATSLDHDKIMRRRQRFLEAVSRANALLE